MRTEQKLAISYCRKSTRVKDKSVEENVDYQQQVINQYADQNGLLIKRQFSDVGYSGKNISRPELQEMLNYLYYTNEKIDQLLIYSIDRFGRDMNNNIDTILEILELVNRVIFVSQNITNDSSYFKLLFVALTSIAEDERLRILKRTADGRKAKVVNRKSFDGNYLPLGFIKREGSEKLVPATSFQTVEYSETIQLLEVQYIFFLYIFEYSLRKIADIMNEKFGKTRRGKDWSYKSVQYILSNPAYTGTLRGKLEGNIHYIEEDANVVQVIDKLTFSYVQAKLEFERVGRKKRTISRNPFLNLCFQCGSFYLEEGNYLVCEECKEQINKEEVINVAVEEIKKILNDQLEYEDVEKYTLLLIEKERKRLEIVIKDLKILQLRKLEIREISITNTIRDRMIKLNTKEEIKLKKKKIELENILKYLNDNRINKGSDINYESSPTLLLQVPFLIVINHVDKEVILIPHLCVLSPNGGE